MFLPMDPPCQRLQDAEALPYVLLSLMISGNEEICRHSPPRFKGVTNNRMELYACVEGIKESSRHPAFETARKVVIHTDSKVRL